jgi:hypothetical protein
VAVTAGRYKSNGGGAAGRLVVGQDQALDLKDRFLADRARAACRQDNLGQAGPIPDDEEGHRLQFPATVQPASDRDPPADVLG